MNCTLAEGKELAQDIRESLPEAPPEVVVCPPFTALAAVAGVLAGSSIALGAQNMYFEPKGAFTGEISPAMLLDVGCRYVILGHSERRRQMDESSELVNRKLKLSLASGLTPIVCVGETWPERSAGQTEQVISEQIAGSLADVVEETLAAVLIAYEPVWAIGTGQVATPEQAEEVHRFVRSLLPVSAGERVRILYGGSVTAENVAGLMAKEDLDGALVGGASLKAGSFAAIVQAAAGTAA
jgi:triosephosphate isomerase (TIM)